MTNNDATFYMNKASEAAMNALCLKARCGTVIIKDGETIGTGYNAPPLDDINNRTCLEKYNFDGKPKYDHTCCMHAEWRAIIDALKNNPQKIKNSTLYFVRVDEYGNTKKSGKPYCTVCSRLALDVGIKDFCLWHENGIVAYPTEEYNRLSYAYSLNSI